ncbi:hypothetical protein D3C78_1167780 [compost metagenome]
MAFQPVLRMGDPAIQRFDQRRGGNRFLQEIHGPQLHLRHGHGNITVTGDDHHRQGTFLPTQLLMNLLPVHARHPNIQHHHTALIKTDLVDELLAVVPDLHPIVQPLE